MPTFLNFTIIGDNTFDFFFSLPASLAIVYFAIFASIKAFRK